jgi:hypothetical protein
METEKFTIKNLSILTPIEAHWLNSKPLDNEFLSAVQATEFYKETRQIRVDYWKSRENKLAYQLKFNSNSPVTFKEDAVEKYGMELINNAHRHLSHLMRRTNVSPAALHVAAIAWYVNEIIDIEKTNEQNRWT